jgi:putative PIN family toxin of toxin-antitoxin system
VIQHPVRIVIDTNVFVRYLLRPGAAMHCLIEDFWLEDKIIVVSATELFQELSQVLDREVIRACIHPDEGLVLLETLQAKVEFLPPLGEIPTYSRDPKDDKFVACAIAALAAFLISEDRDLLALENSGEIQILTPYDFLRQIEIP